MQTVPGLIVRSSPLNRALGVLGDWWTLLVLREAFLGVRTFERLRERLSAPRPSSRAFSQSIARQTLANRLQALVGDEILEIRDREYRLTARGRDLYAHSLLMWRWERRWQGAGMAALPKALVHTRCGARFTPVPACRHCAAEIRFGEVDFRSGPGAGRRLPDAHPRRLTGAARLPAGARGTSVYMVADRWAHLTLGAVFLGQRSFASIGASLGVASNILADRLAILVKAGFLTKRRSASDARCFEYSLTERGRDIFPITLALAEWSNRWLPNPAGPAMVRTHIACGERLATSVNCSECGEVVKPRDVQFSAGHVELTA